MENQEMDIQTMENNLFEDMPQAPTLPKLPKYFPDLQGENRGRTPHAGWYQNDFLPWIQNQDPIQLVGMLLFGALTLIAGLFIIIINIWGWYQNELLPWIQNQDPIQLVGLFLYGGLTLIVISTFTSFQLLLTMWAITIYHSYFGKKNV